MPLWNPHKGTWFSGSLGWSTDEKRVLSREEFAYFSAFGNTVMAEFTRLELLATDMAKSDFISSMSHELRSPLHGILSGTELLHAMVRGADQQEMVQMIDVCGQTLLDTMDHILDYSKINNLRGKTRLNNARAPLLASGIPSTDLAFEGHTAFDLSTLVEDTVESAVAGHRYNIRTASQLRPGMVRWNSNTSAPSKAPELPPAQKPGLEVILNVELRSSWLIYSEVGAWRRILLNLLGNSLKYCSAGFIEVALWSSTESGAHPSKESASSVTMIVEDTGRGMSDDYLQNHLFKPFVQEDNLSAGAGLGLSIVQKLVNLLGGRISIQSEAGIGTRIAVLVPIKFAQISSSGLRRTSLSSWPQKRNLCLLAFDPELHTASVPTGLLSKPARLATALQRALTSQAEQWFDFVVHSIQDIEESRPASSSLSERAHCTDWRQRIALGALH